MQVFRVVCVYEPKYRHLSGSDSANWHFSRGAWRVADSWDLTDVTAPLRSVLWSSPDVGLAVLAIRKPRNGTRVNPAALLKEYQREKLGLAAYEHFNRRFAAHA